jgi:hypothetical protein
MAFEECDRFWARNHLQICIIVELFAERRATGPWWRLWGECGTEGGRARCLASRGIPSVFVNRGKNQPKPLLKSCCRDVGLRLSIVPRRRHRLVKHGMSITEQVIKSRGSLLQRTTRHSSGFNRRALAPLGSLSGALRIGGGGGGGGRIRPITSDVKSILLVDVACERPNDVKQNETNGINDEAKFD